MTILKRLSLLWVIILSFALFGCSSLSVGDDAEMYSREDTEYICKSSSFGKGRGDDIYTALEYIYSDKSIRDEHGCDFEITDNDIVCHTSEGASYLFAGLYEGQAEYSITVNDTVYNVKLSKRLFGNWSVTDCRSE